MTVIAISAMQDSQIPCRPQNADAARPPGFGTVHRRAMAIFNAARWDLGVAHQSL
jgi:hypothetical protein